MRLIQAEANTGTAVAMVNLLRAAETPALPDVTYNVAGDTDGILNMIIEERRRALWLEGRFWSTKIQNASKLWFPRATDDDMSMTPPPGDNELQ